MSFTLFLSLTIFLEYMNQAEQVIKVAMRFIIILIFLFSFQTCLKAQTTPRTQQTIRCVIKGRVCRSDSPCLFEKETKIISCVCGAFGLPDCRWKPKTTASRRCYDRTNRSYKDEGESWERQVGRKTLDCVCERNLQRKMQVSCSGKNRCHHSYKSFVNGDQWKARDVTGLELDCRCHGNERVICRGITTEDTHPPDTGEQQVMEQYIVQGNAVFRPRIVTLQACDTGHQVVRNGFAWNRTTEISDDHFNVTRCECRNAIIQCQPHQISRSREPHCLTDDGHMKRVGEQWVTVHHTHKNIRISCRCRSHGRKSCTDIGFCEDPSPPSNGAMVCVTSSDGGSGQSMYCKPMCLQNFDFVNQQRYNRIWEVCGRSTFHKWSGGYADDALMLAKCTRPRSATRGRESLYLPTENCQDLTNSQIHQIKSSFLRSLRRNYLCYNRCRVKWFKCGGRIPV